MLQDAAPGSPQPTQSRGSRACQAAGELEMNLKQFLGLGAGQAVLAKCLLYSLPGIFRAGVYFHSAESGGKLLALLRRQVPAPAEVS